MTTLLAHFVLLAIVSYATARLIVAGCADRLIAMALLFWGNIVITCLLLSCLGKLGDVAWLFRTSPLLGLATFLLVRSSVRQEDPPSTPTGEKRSLVLMILVFGTLALMLAANLSIAATYEPNNFDSLTYHLPRAMYYLGHGTLSHFETADFRQVFYPFDFNLLQLVCLAHGGPIQAVNFLNVAAWVVTGLSVHRIARLGGCSFNASLGAAWLTLTATEVLAQATSTILDLPTGAALVATLVFVLRWRQTRRTSDALLAGLAVTLSAGTKLTVAFFGPAALLLVLAIGWHHWRRAETRAFLAGIRAWIGPGLLAGVLGAPFLLYNLAATGRLMTDRMDFTLNKPFTLGCALQTAKGYLVQIFCEPVSRFTLDYDQINALNQWFSQNFFARWNEAYAFSPLYTIPPDLNEDHVFFGFAGPLFLLCAVRCLWRDRRLQQPVTWAAVLGLGWFACYFALNKWSLYNQRYFVPAIVVLGPCAAAAWDAGRGRLKRGLFYAVAACGLWFSGHYLLHNHSRPLPREGMERPKVIPDLPPALVERLSAQSHINVSSYGTNELIYPLMHLAPGQRFTSGPVIDPRRYSLFSFWEATRHHIYSNLAYYASYTIVPVPTKRTAGVEFLGTVPNSNDSFDYLGLVPGANEQPATRQNSYIGVVVEYSADDKDPVRLGPGHGRIRIIGLNPGDAAKARISADMADGTTQELLAVAHSDWTGLALRQPIKRLVIAVVADADGQVLGTGEIPFTVRQSDILAAAAISPYALFSNELISGEPVRSFAVSGLASLEGPYPERGWDLPRFRWAKSPAVRIAVPADARITRFRLTLSVRLQVRDESNLEVRHNGTLVKSFRLQGRSAWHDLTVEVPASPGENVLELKDRPSDVTPDWLAYLEQNPDVKQYLLAQSIPLEDGAREHYETHGRTEGRALPMRPESLAAQQPVESLYFLYRSLRVEGLAIR